MKYYFPENFQWGLYYTNYETLERIPKQSAFWYHDVIRDNGFERKDG